MNHKDIINWKIDQLTNNPSADSLSHDFKAEVTSYLAQHQDLQNELAFIESFWKNSEPVLQQPSAQLDVNFYQMLSKAQAAQQNEVIGEAVEPQSLASESERSGLNQTKESVFEQFKKWFSLTPLAQFASLALVFMLGMNFDNASNNSENKPALSALQHEVSSLNTMLAMSMLQKNSASERLTGVAYSKQSDLSDPNLLDQLITLIEKDKSTAVRLAVINTLNSVELFNTSEKRLLSLTKEESNVIVQIELYRLLLLKGSQQTKTQLRNQINQPELKPEVRDFIKSHLALDYI